MSYDRIKWSRNLKRWFRQGEEMVHDPGCIRESAYRPFTRLKLQFARMFVDEAGSSSDFFPTPKEEKTNRAFVVNLSPERPFCCLATNTIPSKDLGGGFGSPSYCFPLYTYSANGKERRDNIPLSTLNRFSIQLDDDSITREHIFYYIYALLHHPEYRARYAENLKRELPRIPIVGTAVDFHAFADIGRKLADLHISYESVKPYKLQRIENSGAPVNWRVEAMKLGKDERHIVYNDWLTLAGIPPEALKYRLGNRSALAWVIDQYRVERDADGELVSDPNVSDDEEAIVRLVGQVIAVSVKTMEIIDGLPGLSLAPSS